MFSRRLNVRSSDLNLSQVLNQLSVQRGRKGKGAWLYLGTSRPDVYSDTPHTAVVLFQSVWGPGFADLECQQVANILCFSCSSSPRRYVLCSV